MTALSGASIAKDATNDTAGRLDWHLTLSFNIRKVKDGTYLARYKAPRGETFSLGDKFSFVLEPSQTGQLLVFNEGKEMSGSNIFHILFPTPSVNGGSSAVSGGTQIETALNTVEGEPGKEILWIIWTREPNHELEDIRRLAFENVGVVRDPAKSAWLKDFLTANTKRSQRNETVPDQETLINGSGDTIVYMSELWPPPGQTH